MHYYKHHIGDFLKDTGHLSNDQMGVYLRMLWKYYLDEKPLHDDCEGIAFAMRSDEKTVRLILRHFFVLTDDGWRHKRCDQEIAEYHNKSEKAKNSATARWSNANAMRTHTERNADATENDANHKPITNNHKPKKESAIAPPTDVDEQVWKDWLTLRKAKKAPVTETVVTNARKEAEKAGVTFQHFLMIWCARGSQGLQADWLKPAERGQSNAVSFAQQERELGWKRWEEMTGREHPDRLAHEGKKTYIDVQATDILEIGK